MFFLLKKTKCVRNTVDAMGYSIFYPYSGMDDKFFKNIYALDGFSNILVVKTNYLVST